MPDTRTQTPMKMVPKNQLPRDVTLKTLEQMAARTKNWGRWGPDDQLGTLNFVTPADIVKAAALVKRGRRSPSASTSTTTARTRTGWGGRFIIHNPCSRRHRCGGGNAGRGQDPLRRRHGLDALQGGTSGTRWGTSLRRKDVERLRCAAPWIPTAQENASTDARPHGGAGGCSTSAVHGRRLFEDG